MKISASVKNQKDSHSVQLQTNDQVQSITIPPKAGGFGSSVNGGELLFLALATCYCNDVYREAAKMSIPVNNVEILVEGEFSVIGAPARNVVYHIKIDADAAEEKIKALLHHTDTVAEIQNTLRFAIPVSIGQIEIKNNHFSTK